MKKQLLFHFLVLIIAVSILGCTIAKISGRGAIPLMMNQPQAKVEVIQKIDTKKQILFDYTGAFDVSEVIGDILIGSNADAIININIKLEVSPGDYLINLITLGLANAKTFHITGDVIKAPEGLSINNKFDVISESEDIRMILNSIPNNLGIIENSYIIVRSRSENKDIFKLIMY